LALQKEQVSYISEMEACVITEKNVSAMAAAKVERNTAILDNTVKMCIAFQN
jgi:hypothetical protein